MPRAAAALSYYLTLSLFPMVICLCSLLNSLSIQYDIVEEFMEAVIPEQSVEIIADFFNYVGGNSSFKLLIAAFITMVTVLSAAFRVIFNTMEDLQGKLKFSGFKSFFLSIIVTVLFPVAIYLSCLMVIGGEWVFNLINTLITPFELSRAWIYLKYVIVLLVMFVLIMVIYVLSAPEGSGKDRRSVGAAAAAVMVAAISVLFSWVSSITAKYPLIYGSMASIIILMVWFYMCGVSIILGNIFNIVLNRHRIKD